MKAVFILLLALPLGILGCSISIGDGGAGNAETVVEEDSFQVSGSPRLVVETENGAITVRSSGGAGEVRVTATIRNPDKVEYHTDQNGDTVSVSADVEPAGNVINARVDVEVVVPEKAQLELETSNGKISSELPITITGRPNDDQLTGDIGDGSSSLRIRTSNGDITIK